MPTIITHAIAPLAAAACLGRVRVPLPLALTGAVFATVPDADVIGFRLGFAYADDWGHRGATHSLMIAAAMAAIAIVLRPQWRNGRAWTFLFLAAGSHGLLDMLTDGCLGVALFWPFETRRHFFPATPIRVSPIGAEFFSMRGLETLISELKCVWLPCAAIAGIALVRDRLRMRH